jgi:AcrR family transcriptional regulator
MKKDKSIEKNASTEEKIKEAAKRVFTKKGYAATRTRDIAEESGYNLALINYYFRSKQKLFDIIMLEHIQGFVVSIMPILNDKHTTLKEKVATLVSHYIDMLKESPDLPIFILSEIAADPKKLIAKAQANKVTDDIYIIEQYKEMVQQKKVAMNPLHLMLNMMSLIVFPFVARPLLSDKLGLSSEQFDALMEERKKLIPHWVEEMVG